MSDSAESEFTIVQGVAPFGMDGLKGPVVTMFRLDTKTGTVMYLSVATHPSGQTVYQWKRVYDAPK